MTILRQDVSLCQLLLEIYNFEVQDVTRLVNHAKSLELAKSVISHYNLHSNSGLQLSLDTLLVRTDFAPSVVEELMVNEHGTQPTQAQTQLLDRVATGRIALKATKFVLETFKRNGWFNDWASRFMQGDWACGSPLILRELLEIGAPATKHLLVLRATRENAIDLWRLVLSYSPDLLYTLTPEDIVYFLTQHYDLEVNVSILIFLLQHGCNIEDEWFLYVKSRTERSFELLFRGRPCSACRSYRECTNPINAAISVGDLALVQEMIADAFETEGACWNNYFTVLCPPLR